jgi:hypothetical protein
MLKFLRLSFGIITLSFFLFVTGPKLYRMCQIRGFLPGASTQVEVITDKWHQTPDQHYDGFNAYWVAWSNKDIYSIGNHRINLRKEIWEGYEIGDSITIVHVPGSKWVYTPDGIYASNGNFLFDGVLAIICISIAVWAFLPLKKSD